MLKNTVVADKVMWELPVFIVAAPFIREIDIFVSKFVYALFKAIIKYALLHILVAIQPVRIYALLGFPSRFDRFPCTIQSNPIKYRSSLY